METRLGPPLLVGATVSDSAGSLGYVLDGTGTEGAGPGTVEGGVTSVQPYVHWAPRNGLTVWGMGGAGSGTLTVSDVFGTVETPVALRMAAGGGRPRP